MVASHRSKEKTVRVHHRGKQVCTSTFLPASPVGKQTGGEKFAVLLSCFFQGADRLQLKSGVGIPDINQKVELRTGYQINLRSGATGKNIFISIERKFYKLQLLNGRSKIFLKIC
jgi:hypothetical protein